uniref:Uncharacterized protein n=1 Tax=Trichuris muris TaxID=70415 RepID=A0A5S6QBD6_TRIMR
MTSGKSCPHLDLKLSPKLDNKAMALLTLSVEDSQLLHVANCDIASEMWKKLEKQHSRFSFGSQLYLRRKIYCIRFTSATMQTHINSMLEVVGLPQGAGRVISTGLVTALEGREEADLSVEYVTGKMMDEYQRRVWKL